MRQFREILAIGKPNGCQFWGRQSAFWKRYQLIRTIPDLQGLKRYEIYLNSSQGMKISLFLLMAKMQGQGDHCDSPPQTYQKGTSARECQIELYLLWLRVAQLSRRVIVILRSHAHIFPYFTSNKARLIYSVKLPKGHLKKKKNSAQTIIFLKFIYF